MKTDREFLDGVYEKAKLIENEKETTRPIRNFRPMTRAVAIAAAVMIVAIPTVIHINQPVMEIPKGYENNTPMAARMYSVESPDAIFDSSEIICTAKVTDIEKSVYEEESQSMTTDVVLKPTEMLKGEITDSKLVVSVNGGFDKETKTYVEYDATFKRGEDVLVFLQKNPYDGMYILSGASQGKYTYLQKDGDDKIYSCLGGTTIAISQLKQKLN